MVRQLNRQLAITQPRHSERNNQTTEQVAFIMCHLRKVVGHNNLSNKVTASVQTKEFNFRPLIVIAINQHFKSNVMTLKGTQTANII